MAETIKGKIADAGRAVAEGAQYVAEQTGLATKEGSDAGVAGIRERMSVIASCGKQIGVVDHLIGGAIQLTKNDSPDGQHHFIPVGWVDHVDSHVHLTKNSAEAEAGWKSEAAACGCG